RSSDLAIIVMVQERSFLKNVQLAVVKVLSRNKRRLKSIFLRVLMKDSKSAFPVKGNQVSTEGHQEIYLSSYKCARMISLSVKGIIYFVNYLLPIRKPHLAMK